jgi:hypothetical protein
MALYKSTGHGELSNTDPGVNSLELPAMPELVSVADRAWTAVATGQKVPGYETALDGSEAVIRDVISPTRYSELRLAQHSNGAWYITEVLQRPSLEDEGFGGTVRETASYPLDGKEHTTRTRTFGYFQDDKLLFPEPEVIFGEPVTNTVCERLLGQLREVMGEGQLEQSRASRRPGLLGWLNRNK